MTQDSASPLAPASGLHFPVVGIGASAGGLAALIKLFESIPASPGMAFVVVLHLSPRHESNAAGILQRATKMTVTQVTGEEKIAPDHIYVIPPTRALLMVDGKLCLGPDERVKGAHVVIDLFFRTLARAHKARAVAVVLSGTGADGAVGIAEIKEQGGVVLAQSPADAEYEGMPASAIATGLVDIVLPLADMGQRLLDLWANARNIELPQDEADDLEVLRPKSPEAAERALARIMGQLQAGTRHDFRHYKRATVLRRIERRLQIIGLPHLPAYADHLEQHPEEVLLLLDDMLIGVTNFFRDRDAFESLERNIVPQLFDARLKDEPLRVWVPGCSTGEEAYSLAILLAQEAESAKVHRPIQLFASDIDEPSIARGREAVYPEAIVTDISPPLLRRYFVKEGMSYRVTKPLRDRVLFAAHNLLRDPPFSRLDLISCRNLLIYLERDVQREILQMFHFALRPGGYLFLGSSETADSVDNLYTVVDKKQRIYRASSTVRASRTLPRFPLGSEAVPRRYEVAPHAQAVARALPTIEELHHRLLQDYTPPSLVVDHEGDILHVTRAEHFLRFTAGVPTQHLLSVIQPELRPALRSALFDLEQTRAAAQAAPVRVMRDDKAYSITLVARPVQHPDWSQELRLILFYEIEDRTPAVVQPDGTPPSDPVVAHLEAELQRTESQLQRSIEQYELSVEDLKASNEELQAINEELRSATEELETSKEELQSTNEELITVNHELKTKVDETAATNDDLQNLIASTGIATIFLERDMRIKRFTPAAAELFNIITSDIGRSLMDITHKLDYDQLADDAAETFDSLQSVEREVLSLDGRVFLARLLPYRTAEHRIDGAVLTFVDVTALRSAQRSVHIDQERMQLIAQSMPGYAIITMDEAGRFTSWSAGAQALFGYREAEVIGKHCALIFTEEDRKAGVHEAEMRGARETGRAEDERWHLHKDGSRVFVSGIMTSMKLGPLRVYTKIARDMTSAKRNENTQHAEVESALGRAARADAANDMKDEFLAVMSHELKHPLNLILVNAQMLMAMPEAQGLPRVQKAASSIHGSVKAQGRIIDDLLDLSRTRSGKLVLNVAPIEIGETLQAAFEWAAQEAAKKKIEFELAVQDTPLPCNADAVRLEQVAMNLLSNSLKFTPAGGRIAVRLDLQGQQAVLQIADNGRGISPSFLPHVFGLFKQAQTHTTRQEGGLGIGLALVQELVQLHGGKVLAASDGEGQGSIFTVLLPLVRTNDRIAPARPAAGFSLDGLRVLLVEDNPDALETFGSLLEIEGAKVTLARSGEEALGLALAEAAKIDLIISDIGMPVMDGYMLMAELRRQPALAQVPAIALTGYGREQDIQRALSAGFSSHVNKPVDLQQLMAEVARLKVTRRA